jgi:hypothetical protein
MGRLFQLAGLHTGKHIIYPIPDTRHPIPDTLPLMDYARPPINP